MEKRRFQRGDLVFEQGATSDDVGLILTGRVEVLREIDGEYMVLGHVGPGDFVGEMGVLEDRPRSATVRAVVDTEIEFSDRDTFLQRISEDPDRSRELLVRLSARLRATDDILVAATVARQRNAKHHKRAPVDLPKEGVVVLPGSKEMAQRLPEDGFEVAVFPYFVGRELEPQETKPPITVDLLLEDRRPYRLSAVHFAVTESNGKYIVRDFGSELGTEVNGELLGGDFFRSDSTPLFRGLNRVVAGGVGSPFVFRVRVE